MSAATEANGVVGDAASLPSSKEPDHNGLRMLPPEQCDIAEAMRPTLKPCPFCGRRPITMCGINDRTGIFVARVTCDNCHATVRGSSKDQADARHLARQRWEARPTAPCDDVEALRAEVERP